jgi:(p)ppGpp synthase/HD superfamily hydrolase
MRGGGKTAESIVELARAAIHYAEWKALSKAMDLAIRGHAGQVDKGGKPYIWHPFRVGFSLLPDVDAAIVGVLHDVLEDCPQVSHGDVMQAVSGNLDLYQDLCALSRAPETGESYAEYILRCGARPRARSVKLADLADNMNPERVAQALANGADGSAMARRQYRYAEALALLTGMESLNTLRGFRP